MTYDEILKQATARPWALGTQFSCHTEIRDAALSMHVAKTSCSYEHDRHADAALIVLAVNSHEALVEALERISRERTYQRTSKIEPVHLHECRNWRLGKNHGPCTCGALEIERRIAESWALVDTALCLAKGGK